MGYRDRMVVEFFDPRGEIDVAQRPTAAPSRGHRGHRSIGLLANGFPDSARFLQLVADRVALAHPSVRFEVVTKPSPPTPLSEDQLARLGACDGVIAAYGH